MCNLTNVKVNETHMCVLRKEEGEDKLIVDFVELKFKYQELFEELERMANNPNRTVLDLHDFVQNSPLRELEGDFNFCTFLDATYQWILSVPKISYVEYKSKIAEFEKAKDNMQKMQYENAKRQEYLKNIRNHILPFMIQEQYKLLSNDPTIVAYSHRRSGWAFPSFNLNNDLKVVYLTNFGYGMSSYFYTQIYYKGIGILPYSEWVHYRFASTCDIIRYTRRHLLNNNEWIKVMDITSEIYNYAVNNPDDFVKHYIINEVEEMVSGLENILNAQNRYKVLHSFFHKNQALYLEGDDLVRFKGEKISGGLNFLEKLKSLEPVCSDIATYLHRIMSCNLSVIEELASAINSKKNFLEKTELEIENLQPIWDEISDKHNHYKEMQDKLWEEIKKEPEYLDRGYWYIMEECDRRFAKAHPEYAAIKSEYDTTQKSYNDLCAKKSNAISFIEEIQSYLDKIEEYKNYIAENEVAA